MPRSQALEENTYVTYSGQTAFARGLHLRLAEPHHQYEFARLFWKSADRSPAIGRRISDAIEASHPRAPRPPEEHHAAWTEAVSRCASYFGIDEASLPSVLVLSWWDMTAVLIRLPPSLSLYHLTKIIVADLGGRVQDVIKLRAEVRRQEWLIYDLEKHPERSQHLFEMWKAQIKSLDRHLELIAALDPALIGQCQANLGKLLSGVFVRDLAGQLRAVDASITGTTEEVALRRRIQVKIRKVIRKLESGYAEAMLPYGLGPLDVQLQKAETALEGARNAVSEKEANLNLAETVKAACQHSFGRAKTTNMEGRRGLEGWKLCIIEQSDPHLIDMDKSLA